MTIFFLKVLCSIILGSTLFVIGVQNPIHSILLLIIVFGLGSIMLFYLKLEFFGLAFLIVYIGAIVILFLFIIMMLDIKMLNTGREEINFFSFKSLVLALLFIMLFTFLNQDFYYLQLNNNFFNEAVLYETSFTLPWVNYAHVIKPLSHLAIVGEALFVEEAFIEAFLLVSFVLFLAMVAAIIITINENNKKVVKQQDAQFQGHVNPNARLNLVSND